MGLTLQEEITKTAIIFQIKILEAEVARLKNQRDALSVTPWQRKPVRQMTDQELTLSRETLLQLISRDSLIGAAALIPFNKVEAEMARRASP